MKRGVTLARGVMVAALVQQGCATSRPVGGGARAPTMDARLEPVSFMSGNWVSEGADGSVTEEHWTGGSAGSMMGISRTMKEGQTLFFEFLRIEAKEGDVVYWAAPMGRSPATPFRLTEKAEKRAVFENQEHDFPTRILYWVDGTGRLHARIEGKPDASRRASEWEYTREGME